MTPTKIEIVTALRTELAEHEIIAREPVPGWSRVLCPQDMPPSVLQQAQRVGKAKRNVSRLKTVLGHLRALWQDEFPVNPKGGART